MSTDPKTETPPATPWPGASPNKRNDEPPVEVLRTEVTVKVNPDAKPKEKP